MQDSDKVNFEQILRATAEVYSTVKKVDVTPILLKLFFASLREYTIEQVSYGFEKHLSDTVDGKFFPKPANIIKHLKVDAPTAEEKAELAWAQVMQCLRANGSYGGLKMDDKQGIAAFKAFTTWQTFCAMDESKMTWAKKEFISMYSTYENTPLEFLPSSLPGLIELQNHKEKYAENGMKSMGDVMSNLNKRRLNKDN